MKTKIETSRVKFQRLIGEAVNSPNVTLTWVDDETKATGTYSAADFKPQRYLNENLMNKVLKGRKTAVIHLTIDFGGVFTTERLVFEERAPSLTKQLAKAVSENAAPEKALTSPSEKKVKGIYNEDDLLDLTTYQAPDGFVYTKADNSAILQKNLEIDKKNEFITQKNQVIEQNNIQVEKENAEIAVKKEQLQERFRKLLQKTLLSNEGLELSINKTRITSHEFDQRVYAEIEKSVMSSLNPDMISAFKQDPEGFVNKARKTTYKYVVRDQLDLFTRVNVLNLDHEQLLGILSFTLRPGSSSIMLPPISSFSMDLSTLNPKPLSELLPLNKKIPLILRTITGWGPDTFYEDPSVALPFWNDLNLVECFKKTNSPAAFADLERRYKGLIVRQTKFIFNNMPSAQMGYEWDDVASEMNVCFIKAIRYIGVDYKRQHGLESSLGTVFERYSTSWRNSVLSYWNNKKRSEAREVEKQTVTVTDKDTGEEKQVEFKLDKGESYANQNPGLLHTSYVGDYTILAQKGGQCALLDREQMIEEELKRSLSTDEMTLFNFLRDKAPRATIANRFGESYMERLRQSLRMKIEKIKETLDFSLT